MTDDSLPLSIERDQAGVAMDESGHYRPVLQPPTYRSFIRQRKCARLLPARCCSTLHAYIADIADLHFGGRPMRAISVRSWLASVLVMLLAVATSGPVTAQAPDDLVALNAQVEKLYGEGKYAEATDIAQRSLALAEWKFGPDHPSVGTSLEYLAELHETQGRDAEAEPLYKRSLAIFEKGLGPDHPADVGRSLDNLAALYVKQGRIAEAEPLLKRALEIRERALPADHADIARSLNNFADLYVAQGRLRESESLLKRALVLTEQKFGPDHRKVGASLTALAMVYHRQGRWPDAGDPATDWAVAALGHQPSCARRTDHLDRLRRHSGRWRHPDGGHFGRVGGAAPRHRRADDPDERRTRAHQCERQRSGAAAAAGDVRRLRFRKEWIAMSGQGIQSFLPWVVVLAAGLIVGVAMGLRQVMGLYMKPVTTEGAPS